MVIFHSYVCICMLVSQKVIQKKGVWPNVNWLDACRIYFLLGVYDASCNIVVEDQCCSIGILQLGCRERILYESLLWLSWAPYLHVYWDHRSAVMVQDLSSNQRLHMSYLVGSFQNLPRARTRTESKRPMTIDGLWLNVPNSCALACFSENSSDHRSW